MSKLERLKVVLNKILEKSGFKKIICEKLFTYLYFHHPIQIQIYHYAHSNAMFTTVAMGIQGKKEVENIVIPSSIFSQVNKPIRKRIYFALMCNLSRLVRKVLDKKHFRSIRTSQTKEPAFFTNLKDLKDKQILWKEERKHYRIVRCKGTSHSCKRKIS